MIFKFEYMEKGILVIVSKNILYLKYSCEEVSKFEKISYNLSKYALLLSVVFKSSNLNLKGI